MKKSVHPLHWRISYQQGDLTCHYPAHLGQSSQDSRKSLKKYGITRGRPPSPLLGALNANLGKVLCIIKHFLAVPQTLAIRGNDKSPQNPSHRMTPSQSFNLRKLLTSRIDLKNPRGFSPVKKTPLQKTDNMVYFPQQTTDSPAWFFLSDYYKSKDHNSSSPVDYSTIPSKLL